MFFNHIVGRIHNYPEINQLENSLSTDLRMGNFKNKINIKISRKSKEKPLRTSFASDLQIDKSGSCYPSGIHNSQLKLDSVLFR